MELARLVMRRAKNEVVPEVGVEPTHPKVHEFESCASANSATPASRMPVYAAPRQLSIGKPQKYYDSYR